MGSIKLKLPNRARREAAFMKKGKQSVAKSVIGPRPKSAERSNERNAKPVMVHLKSRKSKEDLRNVSSAFDNRDSLNEDEYVPDKAKLVKARVSYGQPVPKRTKIKTSVEEFEEEEATPVQLKQISEQARKAVALEQQINDLAAAQLTLSQERDKILNVTLPAMFDSAGMTAFDLEDGSSVEIKDVVSGNLPSASSKPKERERAIAWLLKNGGKGLIKTSFATEFGVDQTALVKKFESLIIKGGFAAKKATGVHHQTLCAFVRELLEKGKKVPIETLGIYVGRHAKIQLSDKQTAKADSERVKPKRRKSSD